MIDTDRKMLTEEVLGEAWHDVTLGKPDNKCSCGRVWRWHSISRSHINRTFDTITDFYALKEKIVESGEWEQFVIHAKHKLIQGEGICGCNSCLSNWLINPARCQTVADWLKERKNDS